MRWFLPLHDSVCYLRHPQCLDQHLQEIEELLALDGLDPRYRQGVSDALLLLEGRPVHPLCDRS